MGRISRSLELNRRYGLEDEPDAPPIQYIFKEPVYDKLREKAYNEKKTLSVVATEIMLEYFNFKRVNDE